jgi:cell surface protein SprA
LRLTDFDQRGGWAATARLDTKLADFADVTVSGSKTSIGFGTLDSRLNDRSQSDDQVYDISATAELGKFFPDKSGIIFRPTSMCRRKRSMPQYDPGAPDIELKQSLAAATSSKERDSIRNAAVDYTFRKSFNFTNVHKTKLDPTLKTMIWDIENLSASYAFTRNLPIMIL